MTGFTCDRPTSSGWYDVIWESGDLPSRVYIHVANDGAVTWAWDEYDDPETVESDIANPALIQYCKEDV